MVLGCSPRRTNHHRTDANQDDTPARHHTGNQVTTDENKNQANKNATGGQDAVSVSKLASINGKYSLFVLIPFILSAGWFLCESCVFVRSAA